MSEWSDWIGHDGKGCPVLGQQVHVTRADGDGDIFIAGSRCSAIGVSPHDRTRSNWAWRSPRRAADREIVRYRTRIYRAGTDLIESVREMEDA